MNGVNAPLSLRARNLLWTVSGDHELDLPLAGAESDDETRALWEAVRWGGAHRRFGAPELLLYSLKKQYMGADPALLSLTLDICLDAAVFPALRRDRAGAAGLLRRAFSSRLDNDFASFSASALGRLDYASHEDLLGRETPVPAAVQPFFDQLRALADAGAALDVIRAADEIYNGCADPAYGKHCAPLAEVLAVTLQDMVDDGFLDTPEKQALADCARTCPPADGDEDAGGGSERGTAQEISAEQAARMAKYISQVFGPSLLGENEAAAAELTLCRGAHADRHVYFTEGLLRGEPQNTMHYKLARQHHHNNEMAYHRRHRVIKQNIHILADLLRRSLVRRSEPDSEAADAGRVVPARLWRVGRASCGRLFERRTAQPNSDFVVDVLIDGSGSQSRRQGAVASQGYILSCALAAAGIPHRVMSYCSVFDYTVLQRFRDFDDPPAACENVFDYFAKAANRDGLAIRAAVRGLLHRREEHKVLIVLSDGRPNDVAVHTGQKASAYISDRAVEDTAQEVRDARTKGVAVFGVFAGLDEDLAAERRIFGRDFAYIRSIETFSAVVGKYLQRCIDDGRD